MKKIRHSWLFAALTIVLGMAVLTGTLAVPTMRVVLNSPSAIIEQSFSSAKSSLGQPATQAATSISAGDAGKPNDSSAESAAVPEVFAMGRQFGVSPQEFISGDRPTLFDVKDKPYGGSWMQEKTVDVFSTPDGEPVDDDDLPDGRDAPSKRNSNIDDAAAEIHNELYDYSNSGQTHSFQDVRGKTRLLYPGISGKYDFTLKNTESFGISWKLAIKEENDNNIPMQFRLTNGLSYVDEGGFLGTVWANMPATGFALNKISAEFLPVAGEREFSLEWRWAYESDDPGIPGVQDPIDTAIGESAASTTMKDPTPMPFYRLNLSLYAESEELFTLIWKDATTGEVYGEWPDIPLKERPEGLTIEEIQALHPGDPRYEIPIPPDKSGYVFMGFVDKDGEYIVYRDADGNIVINDKYQIYPEQLTSVLEAYADWEEEDDDEKPKWKLPTWLLPVVLIPLIPLLPLLPFLPLLPVASLLPLLPFLPGWIGKLIVPDPCCCDGADNCPRNDDGECCCGKADCKCEKIDPDQVKRPDGYVKPPKTGDTMTLAPIYLLLALSSGVVALLSKKRKKDEQFT